MSWPSAYGYKYTPIGLRQREKKDDSSGTRSICTTVHLPQGGHLLDIERQYGLDGSMSKRETQNVDPASFLPSPARPATAEPASSTPLLDALEPRAPTDFERQADDIIANFRARQGLPLERKRCSIPTDLISGSTCLCFENERDRIRAFMKDMVGGRTFSSFHPLTLSSKSVVF
ncbi:uncharacterized protein LOC123504259 isoform X4 [Portunus trituberculatus]|uniref:uncharacterized protein LOC123504259 isoform X4 n=1 Tax=Portunus trituberculatus TaxID=210409 RepID=UPI001E1CFC37|nr:uncharacterized protein LOC123504259 isoform X4 [Portunus trituberculatus]